MAGSKEAVSGLADTTQIATYNTHKVVDDRMVRCNGVFKRVLQFCAHELLQAGDVRSTVGL